MKSKPITWIALGVVILGIITTLKPASAQATDIQQIYADKDTFVSSVTPSVNWGGMTYFYAGNNGTTNYTAYFHFPYTATTAEFQSAHIQITYFDVQPSSFNANIYYVTDDSWTEYGLTWDNQPGVYSVQQPNQSLGVLRVISKYILTCPPSFLIPQVSPSVSTAQIFN